MATEQQRLEFFLKKVDALPAFPGVVTEILRLVDNPLTSIDQIEKVMTTDAGLTVKTLKVANSAYYSIPGGAKTVRRALTYLGMASLKQMLLTTAVYEQLKGDGDNSFDKMGFWKHSFSTATLAELFSRRFKLGTPGDAFICGLVHDMGKVLFHMYDRSEFDRVMHVCTTESVTYEEAERISEVARHGQIGIILAKKWNLPLPVQSAVADHHVASIGGRMTRSPDVNATVDAVYLANRIDNNYAAQMVEMPPPYFFDNDEVLKRNNINPERLSEMAEEIEEKRAAAAAMFDSLLK